MLEFMTGATFIGMLAGALTTISFVPQVIKTLKTKDTSGISLGMYSLFNIGVLLWVLYGAFIGSLPIFLFNGATLVLSLIILALKLKHH